MTLREVLQKHRLDETALDSCISEIADCFLTETEVVSVYMRADYKTEREFAKALIQETRNKLFGIKKSIRLKRCVQGGENAEEDKNEVSQRDKRDISI